MTIKLTITHTEPGAVLEVAKREEGPRNRRSSDLERLGTVSNGESKDFLLWGNQELLIREWKSQEWKP